MLSIAEEKRTEKKLNKQSRRRMACILVGRRANLKLLAYQPRSLQGQFQMEITSFEVSPEQDVTVQMKEMPQIGARTSNTTIYIAGSPLGHPDEVSGTRQTIVFSAASATQSGKVSVMIEMEDGEQLTATSAEDYTAPEAHEESQPVVTRISPTTASPGTQMLLSGARLTLLDGVALGQNLKIGTLTAVTQTSAQFRVPVNTVVGRYPIKIWSKNSVGPRTTSVTLEIE
jgi:hypothetical protein